MAKPTRLSKLGLGGKQNIRNADSTLTNRGDYSLRVVSFVPNLVASASPQASGVFIDPCIILNAGINTTTGEATGVTPTLECGFVGGSDSAVFAATTVNSDNTWIKVSGSGLVASQREELSFTLGSADWADFDGEIILTVLEAN